MHKKQKLYSQTEIQSLYLQIRSLPFRLKINESQTSPLNFRSIGPQKKQDWTFDEVWTVKKKTKFFSLTSKNGGSPLLSLFSFYSLFLLPPVAAKNVGRRRRRGILLLTLLYKGLIRGLKFWALNLGLSHEKKPNMFDLSSKLKSIYVSTSW